MKTTPRRQVNSGPESRLTPPSHAAIKIKKTPVPALMLAASILCPLAQPAPPQKPTTVKHDIFGGASDGGEAWVLPIQVQVPVSGLGTTCANWYESGGINEVGQTVFSANIDPRATFYRVLNASGFPSCLGSDCYCPDLADQTPLDSSYVAIAPNGHFPQKVWISACARRQCGTSPEDLAARYWQFRCFSGDPSQGKSRTLEIGDVPDAGDFVPLSRLTGFNLQGLPAATPLVADSLAYDAIEHGGIN